MTVMSAVAIAQVNHRRAPAAAPGERYLDSVATRSRIAAFGAAAVLVAAGIASAVLLDGLAGRILTTGLLTVGLGGAILLVFLEVGLSEDRALAREDERRRRGRRHRPHGRRR